MRAGGIVSSRGLGFVFGILICTFIFSSPDLRADGKFYPETAYKVPPKIPGQRAIIVYKDGIEKLIVESSLDGPGKEFGWIIPLPSRPTEFEKTSPGLIKTFSLAVQPKITHDLKRQLQTFIFLAILVAFWFVSVCIKKSKRPFLLLVIILASGFLIQIFVMQSLSYAGKDGEGLINVPGVNVTDIKAVGSYIITVLDANNSDALDQWLRGNGYSGLQKDDRVIVDDYIKEKWCFVAAKLKRQSDGGFSQPHPLAMSFTSQRPVYPMRLTSTVGSEVYLEIFLIAHQGADCDGLKLEFSDEFFYQKNSNYDNLPGFVSSKYYQRIGHPQAFNTMWDGCVLSRFCGTLNPSEMQKDIVFELKNKRPYRAHYWSYQGAIFTSVIVFLLSLCAGLFFLTVRFYKKINSSGYKFGLSKVAANSLLLSTVLGLCTLVLLPKTEIVIGKTRSPFSSMIMLRRTGLRVESIYFGNTDKLKKPDINYISKRLSEDLSSDVNNASSYIKKELKNPYLGQIMKNEDSPGNYTIFKYKRGLVFRTYSLEGYPYDYVLGSFGKEATKEPPNDVNTPLRDSNLKIFDIDAVLYK